MRRLRAERRRGTIPDTLILVQHPPVITVGVQGSDGEELPDGIPVVPVERGGKATYHGPGQLVAYPIVDLGPRGRNVRRFVHDLEEATVRTLAGAGIVAGHVPGQRGVWVDGRRKIASVGIAVEEWVTFHGVALNISTDLAAFRGFHPCGFSGDVMTSMERELGRPVPRSPVVEAFVREYSRQMETPVPTGPAPGVPAVPTP